jgi:hypothetical protein
MWPDASEPGQRIVGENVADGRAVEDLDQITAHRDSPGGGQIHQLADDQRVRQRRSDT